MAYSVNKVQTAFRLPLNLLSRLKRNAQLENKSLNAYVEEILTREAKVEWPKLPKGYSASADDLFQTKGHVPSPTKEMMASDPKLAYIWNKGA